MNTLLALATLVALPMVDTPVDYTAPAATIGVVLGGLAGGLLAVLAGALAIRGVRWGIPKIIGFFSRVS